MANFDEQALRTLIGNVTDHAETLGMFRTVNGHEPKSAPGHGITLAVWIQAIDPLPAASGLASTTGRVELRARVYGNALVKPEDDVDPRTAGAAVALMGAYSGDFNFGATVRDVDLLGQYGPSLSARAGYVTIGSTVYRIMDVTVPVIVNDMWTQTP